MNERDHAEILGWWYTEENRQKIQSMRDARAGRYASPRGEGVTEYRDVERVATGNWAQAAPFDELKGA